jgi:hypothetical protein
MPWLDRSPALLLACCSECAWRSPAAGDVDGWRQLTAHLAACHPTPARKNVVQNLRRFSDGV